MLLSVATSCAITPLEHARGQEDAAIAWVRQEAVPLRTATPTDADEDIAAARDMFGDASVVGLGEATHGTREFFQLKHRLLRMLVEEQGFTVFAIEAHFTAALAVNDYVLEGKGDAVQALAGLEYWTWYTEEVLELIEWMRSYNETVEPERRVRFMGCDMADGDLPAEYVLEYLRNVDPDVAREVEPQLARDLSTISGWFGANAYKRSSSRQEWLREREARRTAYPGVEARAEALAERLQTYVDSATNAEDRMQALLAARNAIVLLQFVRFLAVERPPDQSRDHAMADNVAWIQEHVGPRVVVWAHNAHVARQHHRMGQALAEHYGSQYVPVGFVFDHGGFRAVRTRGLFFPRGDGLRDFRVRRAPAGTLPNILARSGEPLLVADLRSVPAGTDAARWFDARHQTREIGATYDPTLARINNARRHWPQIYAREAYDVLVFVEATTPSRPAPDPSRPSPAD